MIATNKEICCEALVCFWVKICRQDESGNPACVRKARLGGSQLQVFALWRRDRPCFNCGNHCAKAWGSETPAAVVWLFSHHSAARFFRSLERSRQARCPRRAAPTTGQQTTDCPHRFGIQEDGSRRSVYNNRRQAKGAVTDANASCRSQLSVVLLRGLTTVPKPGNRSTPARRPGAVPDRGRGLACWRREHVAIDLWVSARGNRARLASAIAGSGPHRRDC